MSTNEASMTGDEFMSDGGIAKQRADRLRRQYEGTQSWAGSPQDYEDVLGPRTVRWTSTRWQSGKQNTGLRQERRLGHGNSWGTGASQAEWQRQTT